jgi:hypothetical protein
MYRSSRGLPLNALAGSGIRKFQKLTFAPDFSLVLSGCSPARASQWDNPDLHQKIAVGFWANLFIEIDLPHR